MAVGTCLVGGSGVLGAVCNCRVVEWGVSSPLLTAAIAQTCPLQDEGHP